MDLSFWLTTVSLLILLYAGGKWIDGAYLAPRRAAQSVKKKRRRLGFTKRSQRSERSNAVNAGSAHQDAGSERSGVQSVQPATAAIAPPAGDVATSDGGFTLTPRELVQLAEALHLRREGATVEQAVSQGFGVTKGGSVGYVRAKALFDAATVAPGAAPAGTYAPPARPRRRRAPAAR